MTTESSTRLSEPYVNDPVWIRALLFIVDQTRKTIRRPWRIVIIARERMIRSVIRIVSYALRARYYLTKSRREMTFPTRFADLVRSAPSRQVMKRPDRLVEEAFFLEALDLLQQNQPREASIRFWKAIEHSTDPNKFFTAGVNLLQGLGRFNEAMALFAHANKLRQKQAMELGVGGCRYVVLDNFWSGAYGHTAGLDYLIKYCILEGLNPQGILFCLPERKHIANRFWVDQWRPFLRLVEDTDQLPIPREAIGALAVNFLAPRLHDGSTVHLWKIAADTYRRWHALGKGPIQTFPADLQERGWAALESVGVSRDAWFVTMHVREAGSKSHHVGLHNVLNASIYDYLPAIREITSRGGWVIRVGDPSMVPLEPMQNVLDYCHSPIRSEWMDVFLCAASHFFVGTSSGPAYVPPTYGVPCVLTNWWPLAQRPWHAQDIFIPKRYRRVEEGQFLTLAQSLVEPFGYCNSVDHLREREGVVIEDNDPHDICAAVREMFDRVEGTARYDQEDLALRVRADEVFEKRSAFGMGLFSRDFIKKNKSFLD